MSADSKAEVFADVALTIATRSAEALAWFGAFAVAVAAGFALGAYVVFRTREIASGSAAGWLR